MIDFVHMKHLESEPHVAQARETVRHGREAIPVGAALEAQIELIRHMVGESAWNSFDDTERDRLVMEWMEKYAGDKFNVFAEYCDAHVDDTEFMDRAIKMKLESKDFEALKKFAEESPRGGTFIVKH